MIAEDPEIETAFSAQRSKRAQQRLWASSFADHVSEADTLEAWSGLFEQIEEQGLLLEQAQTFGSFQKSLETLERHVLPAAIRLGNDDRFLRYAATVATLRNLAEVLFEAGVLPALMAGEGSMMARDLAAQLSRGSSRAAAFAALAATRPAESKEARELEKQTVEELTRTLRPVDEASAQNWADALVGVARHLPSRLAASWPGWLQELKGWPDAEQATRRAVVEAWLRLGQVPDDAFWSLLIEGPGPQPWLDLLPARLAELLQPEEILARLNSLPAGWEILAQRILAAVLGQAAKTSEAAARDAWRKAGKPSEIFAAEPCVELAKPFLRLLDDEELAALGKESLQPQEQARLWLAVAEATGRPEAVRRARRSLQPFLDSPFGLHARLRLLEIYSRTHVAFVAAPLRKLAYRLEGLGFQVASEDLARYLDLVAQALPRRLRSAVDAVLASPAGQRQTLLDLARKLRQDRTLGELLDRAEILAAKVADDEAQGFVLRAELLILVGCRLNDEEARPEVVRDVLGRLLPEEEDDFRIALAETYHQSGRNDLAAEVSGGLRSPRRRLANQLRYQPNPHPDLLSPANLYRASVDISLWEDELEALAVLQELPTEPAQLGRRIVAGVTRHPRRLLALADLALHVLEFEQRALPPKRRDALAALLPLKEALGVVESESWLTAFTPELVAIGSVLGSRYALAEHQEAMERLLDLKSVPWSVRREAIEALLSRLPQLANESVPGSQDLIEFADWLSRFYRWLARREGENGAAEPYRRTALLLVASFEALPARLRQSLHRSRWKRWARYLRRFLGDRLWHLVANRSIRRNGAADDDLQAETTRWPQSWPSPPLDPDLLPQLRADVKTREAAARLWLTSPHRIAADAEDWIYLLAGQKPDLAVQLVSALPTSAERDSLTLRLLRHGWLDARSAAALPVPEDEAALRLNRLWMNLREPQMLPELYALVRRGALDPWHPECAPVRRRLWQLDSPEISPDLASETLAAFHQAGRNGGSRALVWWLNALLAPKLGKESSAKKIRLLTLRASLEASKNLGPSEGPSPDS